MQTLARRCIRQTACRSVLDAIIKGFGLLFSFRLSIFLKKLSFTRAINFSRSDFAVCGFLLIAAFRASSRRCARPHRLAIQPTPKNVWVAHVLRAPHALLLDCRLSPSAAKPNGAKFDPSGANNAARQSIQRCANQPMPPLREL